MKEIKARGINLKLLFLILINFSFAYYCLNRSDFELLIKGIVFINLIFWLVNYKSNYYFFYDNKRLVIRNSWNPFVNKEYDFDNIKQAKVGYKPFLGKSLIIIFDNGEKRAFGASNCSTKQLDKFVGNLKFSGH